MNIDPSNLPKLREALFKLVETLSPFAKKKEALVSSLAQQILSSSLKTFSLRKELQTAQNQMTQWLKNPSVNSVKKEGPKSSSSERNASPQTPPSTLARQVQHLIEHVRVAIQMLSNMSRLNRDKVDRFQEEVGRLKPLVDSLIKVVSTQEMGPSGNKASLFSFQKLSQREKPNKQLPMPSARKRTTPHLRASRVSTKAKEKDAPTQTQKSSKKEAAPLLKKEQSLASSRKEKRGEIIRGGEGRVAQPSSERQSLSAAPFTPEKRLSASRSSKKKREKEKRRPPKKDKESDPLTSDED